MTEDETSAIATHVLRSAARHLHAAGIEPDMILAIAHGWVAGELAKRHGAPVAARIMAEAAESLVASARADPNGLALAATQGSA